MQDDRKIQPLDESSSRQIWVGWGAGVVCMALAFLVGGIFAPYLLLFIGATMALRGHLPGLFAKHVDARIIAGTPYRREESVKAWSIATVACLLLAGAASWTHLRIAPEKPDLVKTILDGIKQRGEQHAAPAPFSITFGESIIRDGKTLSLYGPFARAYCGQDNTLVPIDFMTLITITNRQSTGATISSVSLELLTERGQWEQLVRIKRIQDGKPTLFYSADRKSMTEMTGIESLEDKLRERTLQSGESVSGVVYFAFPRDHIKIPDGSVAVRITIADALGNLTQSQDRSAFNPDSLLPKLTFRLWPLVDPKQYRFVLYADSCPAPSVAAVVKEKSFSTLIPFSLAEGQLIPINANLRDPKKQYYGDISDLAMEVMLKEYLRDHGGSAPKAGEQLDFGSVKYAVGLRGDRSESERSAFIGRLLQYYSLLTIFSLQNGVAFGIEVIGKEAHSLASPGIKVPEGAPYPLDTLLKGLDGNQFSDTTGEQFMWPHRTITAPRGATFKLSTLPGPPIAYSVRLVRPRSFSLEISIVPQGGTGSGGGVFPAGFIPFGLTAEQQRRVLTYVNAVNMKLELDRNTLDPKLATEYVNWSEALFGGFQQRMEN